MPTTKWEIVLHEIAEQQLRRQNVNTAVLLIFGRHSCPEPALRDSLDAYVMGESLPPALWSSLMQRLKAADFPQKPVDDGKLATGF